MLVLVTEGGICSKGRRSSTHDLKKYQIRIQAYHASRTSKLTYGRRTVEEKNKKMNKTESLSIDSTNAFKSVNFNLYDCHILGSQKGFFIFLDNADQLSPKCF